MTAMHASAALWFLPGVAVVSAWVAWSDMRAMRIPNAAVLALLGIYLVLGPFLLPLAAWGWGWVHFGVVLAAGFLLTIARLIGAGDAKFAAAMAPFIASGDVAVFMLLFAAVLLAAFLTHRVARATPSLRGLAPHWDSWNRNDFPMGLALGGALVVYLSVAALQGA